MKVTCLVSWPPLKAQSGWAALKLSTRESRTLEGLEAEVPGQVLQGKQPLMWPVHKEGLQQVGKIRAQSQIWDFLKGP